MLPTRRIKMEAVQESLRREYARFCKSFGRKASHYGILQMKTKSGLPLRGYFLVLIHEYIKQEGGVVHLSKHFIDVQMPFLLEGLISVLYYDNQILDRKFGVIDNDRIGENLMRRNQLYDEILAYSRKNIKNRDVSDEMVDLIQEIHKVVGTGQEWERKYNHYDSWVSTKFTGKRKYKSEQTDLKAIDIIQQIVDDLCPFPKNKRTFLNDYLFRIYFLNASLFAKTTAFILRHSDLQKEKKDSLIHFAGLFGMMIQIVNDNCDFVPKSEGLETTTKNCCDSLSDLRNMNITLPIAIHLIREKTSKTKFFLDTGATQNVFLGDEQYVEDLAESNAIFYSMRVGKEIEKHALSLLNPNNPTYERVKDMTSVARNNRYYRYFYGLKNHYKRYQKTANQKSHDSLG